MNKEPYLGDYPKSGKKSVTVSLDVELHDELKRIAADKRVTLSALVAIYIGEALHRAKLNP